MGKSVAHFSLGLAVNSKSFWVVFIVEVFSWLEDFFLVGFGVLAALRVSFGIFLDDEDGSADVAAFFECFIGFCDYV